jgi:hypothetical protein
MHISPFSLSTSVTTTPICVSLYVDWLIAPDSWLLAFLFSTFIYFPSLHIYTDRIACTLFRFPSSIILQGLLQSKSYDTVTKSNYTYTIRDGAYSIDTIDIDTCKSDWLFVRRLFGIRCCGRNNVVVNAPKYETCVSTSFTSGPPTYT